MVGSSGDYKLQRPPGSRRPSLWNAETTIRTHSVVTAWTVPFVIKFTQSDTSSHAFISLLISRIATTLYWATVRKTVLCTHESR